MKNAPPGKRQRFEGIVDIRRVACVRLEYRFQVIDVVSPVGRFQLGLTCFRPVPVSLDCVDLAVMAQHAERMSQLPARKSICAESLMENGKGGFILGRLKIDVKFVQGKRRHEPFVNDGPAGERRRVEIVDRSALHLLFNFAPRDVERPFKLVGAEMLRLSDQHLTNIRLCGGCLISQVRRICRDDPPAEKTQFTFGNDRFDCRFARGKRVFGRMRHEQHSHREIRVPVNVRS